MAGTGGMSAPPRADVAFERAVPFDFSEPVLEIVKGTTGDTLSGPVERMKSAKSCIVSVCILGSRATKPFLREALLVDGSGRFGGILVVTADLGALLGASRVSLVCVAFGVA